MSYRAVRRDGSRKERGLLLNDPHDMGPIWSIERNELEFVLNDWRGVYGSHTIYIARGTLEELRPTWNSIVLMCTGVEAVDFSVVDL